MDIKKLKKTHPQLLEYMKANGYGKVAIGGVKVMLRRMFDHDGIHTSKLAKMALYSRVSFANSIFAFFLEEILS